MTIKIRPMLLDHLLPFELQSYDIKTLKVESSALEGNPLGDTAVRYNPVLVPKGRQGSYPVVLVLSGYAGDGFKNLSFKGFESNLAQDIDMWTGQSQAPEAIYVFVNAWTSWGGSQFINSQGCGNYEDYIVNDLYSSICDDLPAATDAKAWTVFGGSSGGYGALSLASKFPEKFKNCLSIAPDSFFELSLLPEIYAAYPHIQENGFCKNILDQYKKSELKLSGSTFFKVFNAIAMSYCYAEINSQGEPVFPIDESGILNPKTWEKWKQNDPINFLSKRCEQLKKLKSLYLSVGTKDEYSLQFGARQIKKIVDGIGINNFYKEFKGTHRDLSKDRQNALTWLKSQI